MQISNVTIYLDSLVSVLSETCCSLRRIKGDDDFLQIDTGQRLYELRGEIDGGTVQIVAYRKLRTSRVLARIDINFLRFPETEIKTQKCSNKILDEILTDLSPPEYTLTKVK